MFMKISSPFCLILISVYTIAVTSCSNSKNKQILGEWTRQHNFKLGQGIDDDTASWGDITFSVDSTFVIQGDSPKDTATLSVPGWHVGEETTGTWQVEKNLLQLYPDAFDRKFPITFEIVTLTKQKLVLLLLLSKRDSTNYLSYLRKQ